MRSPRPGFGSSYLCMRFSSLVFVSTLACACSNGTAESYTSVQPTPSVSAGSSDSPTTSDSGSSSATDSSTSATTEEGPFRLLFRDEFDELNLNRWQLMTHSWGGNLAMFSKESPILQDGQLLLRLLPAPEGTRADGEDKQFLGAEVRSKATLTYGRVRARIRFARASAVVSSLVTIYTPWPADNWNELDIESLGKDPDLVQFNTMVYTGPKVETPATESVSPTQHPYLEELGFDSSLEYHDYTIEWTPEEATFWVDGQQRYVWSERMELMTLPQNVLLTIWASDSESWAGPVNEQTAGATVAYDWVELWEYTGPLTAANGSAEPTDVTTSSETTASGDSSTAVPDATGSTQQDPTATSGDLGSTSNSVTTNVSEQGDSASSSSNDTDSEFQLLFRDDFDSLDTNRWQLMTHSWESNLALFSADSVAVADGQMTLTLLDAPNGTSDDTGAQKQFFGAEVRSVAAVPYGRVRARARFSSGSGVVSSLVAIYTPWPADDWNELDIEHLGFSPSKVQFNTMVYLGSPVSPDTSVTPTQFPELMNLGFDASADFHEYEMEWTPEYVQFSVDGINKHRWTEHVDLLGLPQNILLTIWASSSPDWAGPINESTSSANAVYDWVEVYAYQGK
jgi:endo-1,3-1,4-beta-glycanase ExoK